MIPARKHVLFNFWLQPVMAWTLRRRFHNIYLAGGEHLDALAKTCPVVGCVNHTNWWDGFVLYFLSHRLLPHEIYLGMEDESLRRYPFFAWMGAFGVRGMRYAVRLLRVEREALVWMFVQGRLLPAGTPIAVKPGALFLARQTGANILPLVLRYEWLSESRPSVFVHVGRPLPATVSEGELGEVLGSLFARVPAAASAAAFSDYRPLFGGKMSLNKWWDYWRHRLRREPEPFERQNP